MKTRKRIDNYVQKDLVQYQNSAFLDELKAEVAEPIGKKHHTTQRILVLTSVGILVVVLLCCGIFLWNPWNKKTKPTVLDTQPAGTEGRQYLLEDERTEIITPQEFFSATQTMQFSEENLSTTAKVVNTQYNEVLYYILDYNCSEFDDIKIYICNNNRYECSFYDHTPYNHFAEIKGYPINFVEQFTEEDGIFFFKTKGEINLEGINIYIVYNGIGTEETSDFVNLLFSIIQ